MPRFAFDLPSTQLDFAYRLQEIRADCLQDSLSNTAASMDINELDTELHRYVENGALQILARKGLRGELLFAVPSVLIHNPRLLGYYRLLLGYSQKDFYTADPGAGMFHNMEKRGRLSQRQKDALPELCDALNTNAVYMLNHLADEMVSASFFDQLTLLTLGPQLRGGANVKRGSDAISKVFNVILQIVAPAVIQSDHRQIILRNNSGRTIYIQFSPDPDIVIRAELAPEHFRNLVAIEVKGGQDYSNIHNRIGEAEKSHQKARENGYIECWTVVNVDRIDMEMAHRESPTTNQFYRISGLLDQTSEEYREFSLLLLDLVGI